MKVAVIGCGRVGLPLALALREAGVDVFGIDPDPYPALDSASLRQPGFNSGNLEIYSAIKTAPPADAYIICVNTSYDALTAEPDIAPLMQVAAELGPLLKHGDLVVCRSTLAPGLGNALLAAIKRASPVADFRFAYCPERMAEGREREELATLPQMIGADDPVSAAAARYLMCRIGMPILPTATIREVELAKLYCNAARYADFAIANSLFALSDGAGCDPHRVRALACEGYPRAFPTRPGLTAGPCLRKDWGLLVGSYPEADLLRAAWRTNEDVPRILIEGAIQRKDSSLIGEVVGVLGLAFKADTDDTRDSLAIKLCRLLLNEDPAELHVHDPHAPPIDMAGTVRVDDPIELCRRCNVIFLATPHSQYVANSNALVMAALNHGALIVDVWGALGQGLAYIQ